MIPATISVDAFRYVCEVLRRESAIELDESKLYLVMSRLAPVAQLLDQPDVETYLRALRKRHDPRWIRLLVEAMTTNETSFFRDREPFNALRDVVIPEMMKRRRTTRALNVWSAACSSGQEAYSVAMIIAEINELAGWRTTIHATDIHAAMVERAKHGRFSQLEVNRGLPVSLLMKYFEKDRSEYVAKPILRNMVAPRQLNLAKPLPHMPTMDIIMLRNVLIYFDPDARSQVLQRIRTVLAPDGYVMLGTAEHVTDLDEQWQRVGVGRTYVYQTKGRNQ